MRIIRFQEELHSTNSAMFKKAIYKLSGVRPQDHMAIINKVEEYKNKLKNDASNQANFLTKLMPKSMNKLFEKKSVNKIHSNSDKIYAIDLSKKGFYFY
jgi:hypothetical protein